MMNTMNTLLSGYRSVIDHAAGDIETLQQSGRPGNTAALNLLQKRLLRSVCRKDRLNEQRGIIISGFKPDLENYLYLCENFWKELHGRTYEKKMDDLLEVKRRTARIYSLTGFDACYTLLLALKPLRGILPLPRYDEHAPALSALEQIKDDCISRLRTYIKI